MPFIPDQQQNQQSTGFTPDIPIPSPTKRINFLQRAKLGFGGPEAQAQQKQLETQSGLAGKFDIGDIADVAGNLLPFAGGILGGAGGAIAGMGVGAIPGAAIGSMAGESAKQAIGRAMGVREDVPLSSEATDIAKSGAFTYAGGKIGGYALSRIPKLFSIFTGESDEVINEALRYPKIADNAIKNGDEALRTAIQTASEKSIQIRNSFNQGYREAFNTISQRVKGTVSSAKELKQVLIKELESKGVKITKEGLDFSTSRIKANPGEISKINGVYEALQNWKDFSLKGVNEFKQLVGGLTKFADEAGIPSKSPTLGKYYHDVGEIITKKLPSDIRNAYTEMNNLYSKSIDLYDEVVDAFNKGDTFSRIAGALGRNKDALRQIVDFYEKQSGNKILPILAGRELGAERNAAFGFLNPRQWIDFFISPKTQARVVTKSAEIVGPILKTGQKAYQNYQRFLGVRPNIPK